MKMAAVCVLWAAGLAAQTVGEMPEPPAYGQLYYWDAAARALRAVPYEMVRVRGKREERVAEFRGARAKLRFVEGAVPALVIAYASLPAGEWVSRMYLLESTGGLRRVPLGVWAAPVSGELSAGAVPTRMEKHGRFSYRLVTPVLRPGEYVVRSEGGSGGFAFGVDGK
jgi:hypothetical protein